MCHSKYSCPAVEFDVSGAIGISYTNTGVAAAYNPGSWGRSHSRHEPRWGLWWLWLAGASSCPGPEHYMGKHSGLFAVREYYPVRSQKNAWNAWKTGQALLLCGTMITHSGFLATLFLLMSSTGFINEVCAYQCSLALMSIYEYGVLDTFPYYTAIKKYLPFHF